MGNKYYYLVASLPVLEFGKKPPVSYKDFLDDCRRILQPDDFEAVAAANLDPEGTRLNDNCLLANWDSFKIKCCNEAACFRATEAGKDPYNYLRGDESREPQIARMIEEAAKNPNPLITEKMLDESKWHYLDGLLSGHYFDLEWLIVYALKLQILERHQQIDSPKGRDLFKQFRHEVVTSKH